MAPELVQDTGERGPGPPSYAPQPADTDGRGQQQARVQDEQRLLEPGKGPAPEHGAEPLQLEPELARARLHQLHPGALALAAEQREPAEQPRHHPRGSRPAAAAAAAAAEHAAGAQPVQPIVDSLRDGHEPIAGRHAAAAAADSEPAGAAASATAATRESERAAAAGARACAGAGSATTAAAHAHDSATTDERAGLAG